MYLVEQEILSPAYGRFGMTKEHLKDVRNDKDNLMKDALNDKRCHTEQSARIVSVSYYKNNIYL